MDILYFIHLYGCEINMGSQYKVGGKEFDSWTDAQDSAVFLLENGHEYVQIMIWGEEYQTWCLLQELNLERGIMPPSSGWNTHSLAPYYVRLRNL